ncbi:hypothetical protein [Sphingosinicella sp. YJ22]|uniref:hypothetical protein n=1 Tax=Sphingosinicella sp. YJ22 TaxID=1104780 RepID=UPI001409CE07|nr:hypothetical protein [Sphingosinicella sp. YJ22]
MSKIGVVLGLIALTGGGGQAADRFAIQCTGDARFTDTFPNGPTVRNYDLPRQVFVFDETAERVQRVLEPRQEFEEVCAVDGYLTSVDFSAGLIQVRADNSRYGYLCEFKVNRADGTAQFFTHRDLPHGNYSEIEWRMTCSPTEIPVFDSSRNRF